MSYSAFLNAVLHCKDRENVREIKLFPTFFYDSTCMCAHPRCVFHSTFACAQVDGFEVFRYAQAAEPELRLKPQAAEPEFRFLVFRRQSRSLGFGGFGGKTGVV